jgi:uncharacterized membrane protein YukC
MSGENEEEKLPDKFNLRIWVKIGKYALQKWPLLIVIVLMMLVTTYLRFLLRPHHERRGDRCRR